MRILHVINALAVKEGGPPVVCAGLAEAQARAGHAVAVAAVHTGGPGVALDPVVERREFAPSGSLRYLRSSALDAFLRATVPTMDMVHVHTIWQYPPFAASRACRAAGVPYVLMSHGMLDAWAVTNRSVAVKRLYWLWRGGALAGHAAALHCLNDEEVARVVPWVRKAPKFVVPNGVAARDLEALPPRGRFRARHEAIGGRPLVLFLSRLHPKKGLDRLLPAWPQVLARAPECRLAIAGSGSPEYEARVDHLIASSGLQSSVLRVGQLAGAAKYEALVDADVFVLPSHQEGFSMAITEALGVGCAAVVTDACHFDEVASCDAGAVIAGDDMNAFTDAVVGLLSDEARRRRCGANGRALVLRKYTWESVAQQLDQVYAWICAGKRLPADGQDVWRSAAGVTVAGPGTPG